MPVPFPSQKFAQNSCDRKLIRNYEGGLAFIGIKFISSFNEVDQIKV